MREAVDRIAQAISAGEQIVVYGDFDADGVTSTSLLTIALRHFGAKVEPYIPNRVLEGYGLNADRSARDSSSRRYTSYYSGLRYLR